MVNGKSSNDHFEIYALDERLRLDKNADPMLIVQALDDLADVNFRALNQPKLIMKTINQTLAEGLSYKFPPVKSLLSLYFDLKNTLSEMIEQVDNLSWSNIDGKYAEEYQKVLDNLNNKISPALSSIDGLFRVDYHRPSPLPKSQTHSKVNILSMLDYFNSVFKEPVKNAHHLLSGGAKPTVCIGNVETVEELVRVLHDGGLEKIRHILYAIIKKEAYSHLKTVKIFEKKGYIIPDFLIEGVGYLEVTKFKNSPMWPIAEAMVEYDKNNNTIEDTVNLWTYKVMNNFIVLMTTKSLSSTMKVDDGIVGDKVNCSLNVFYDVKQKNFSIEFYFGNKGYFSSGFMKAVKESFSSNDYKYNDFGSENKDVLLNKKSYAEYVKQDVRFIFDNLKEKLLMSYKR